MQCINNTLQCINKFMNNFMLYILKSGYLAGYQPVIKPYI